MVRSRVRDRVAEWIVIVVIGATCFVSGCGAVINALPDGGPMSAAMAEDYARLAAGASVASIEVVSSHLSTYAVEHPGGTAAAPDRAVWSVVLKGAFPYGSCTFNLGLGASFGSARPAPTYKPCPAPALRERILLDANDGRVIERIVPG